MPAASAPEGEPAAVGNSSRPPRTRGEAAATRAASRACPRGATPAPPVPGGKDGKGLATFARRLIDGERATTSVRLGPCRRWAGLRASPRRSLVERVLRRG